MCGIVGLHLRTQELYPRLGELLTGMLCEMGDRGSDSAGVAVYGDPVLSPPGQGCLSVLEVMPTAEDIGLDVNVTRHADTYLLTAPVSSAAGAAAFSFLVLAGAASPAVLAGFSAGPFSAPSAFASFLGFFFVSSAIVKFFYLEYP